MNTSGDGYLETYLEQLEGSISVLRNQLPAIDDMVNRLVATVKTRQQILAFGNGGSSATTSHFMVDISKFVRMHNGPPVKAICLSDNIPTLTAWANDDSYDVVFAERVRAHADVGDVVVAVSCSGNSKNVLRGVEQAEACGAYTIGVCGFDGGLLAAKVNSAIVVPGERIQQVEDVHHVLLHVVSIQVAEQLDGLGAEPYRARVR